MQDSKDFVRENEILLLLLAGFSIREYNYSIERVSPHRSAQYHEKLVTTLVDVSEKHGRKDDFLCRPDCRRHGDNFSAGGAGRGNHFWPSLCSSLHAGKQALGQVPAAGVGGCAWFRYGPA